MRNYFADLHIHIGRSQGLPVKITASPLLTFNNILEEASMRKGMDIIGVIDAHSPPVQAEITEGLRADRLKEHPDGGIIYKKTLCLLGVELEIAHLMEGKQVLVHVLIYFPYLYQIKIFTKWLAERVRNVQLSTCRFYGTFEELYEQVSLLEGIIVPAHVFTPYKGILGQLNSLSLLGSSNHFAAVELGLGGDAILADQISELAPFTFLSNSDAHSLDKIGREYNELTLKEPSFFELKKALLRQAGRKVMRNYGLNPRLSKYYFTACLYCKHKQVTPDEACNNCGKKRFVRGVYQRIKQLEDQKTTHPLHRAPYFYHLPLEFIPKVGPKMINKLLKIFGTEMNIMHFAPIDKIVSVAGESIAAYIVKARNQQLDFVAGGAGRSGTISK